MQNRLLEASLENWDNGFFSVKCHRIALYDFKIEKQVSRRTFSE